MAADPLRWRLLKELARSDRRVRELVSLSDQPQNLVSYHLGQLRTSGLVASRRSSFDRRDTYYHLDLARCAQALTETGAALHPGLRLDLASSALDPAGDRGQGTVLFLCTGNSARSQAAEALAQVRSDDRVQAFSAGSHPKPIHPNVIRVLASRGIDLAGRQSKHLSAFSGKRFDYVITLCDRVREVCPKFPGHPGYIHWSIPDPAASGTSDESTYHLFEHMAAEIETRVGFWLTAVVAAPARTSV